MYQNDPVNHGTLFKAISWLADLLRIRYQIKDPGKEQLGKSIAIIMRDIGLPLGVVQEDGPDRFKWNENFGVKK
jgi:hypothetical protein